MGAYYRSATVAGFQLCTRCNAAVISSASGGHSGARTLPLTANGRPGRQVAEAAAAGPLVCVPHRVQALPPLWEDAVSDSGRATPEADDYEMRLGQLQVQSP